MSDSPRRPFRVQGDGLLLFLRVTPRASRDEVAGVDATGETSQLAVKVRAVPEKGKANGAVERLVATWLSVPKTSVSVTTGQSARMKTVRISGDPEALAARIAALLDGLP